MTEVEAVTALVVTGKVALVAPAATVTLAGTLAAALLLESVTIAPPVGAAVLKVAVPVEEFGPTTLAGLTESDARLAAAGAACGVKLRVAENEPNTPAELRARTRHQRRCAGNPLNVTCEPVTIWSTT